MHTRRIQVKNGRLVLDEPTDLPEGAEVDVLVIDDELTAEERVELHASLRQRDGRESLLERYRARREDRPARCGPRAVRSRRSLVARTSVTRRRSS
jgi:hypothetical protein